MARQLADDGIPFIVLTRGKDGATAFGPGFSVEQESMPVPGGVADTVGAGDSFHGGLLAALHHAGMLTPAAIRSLDESMAREVLEFAGRVAAITCSRPGADPPWAKEM
ncbi:MAG: PfkB family carbohydrate kinase [Spirochaetia bacterium]